MLIPKARATRAFTFLADSHAERPAGRFVLTA